MLIVCSLSQLTIGIDNSIVNLALPAIRLDFSASLTELQWVIDAYQLVLGSLLLLSGALADRFGRRRVFVVGLLGFIASSVLCSIAPTVGALIASRVLQGTFGALLNPVAISIVAEVYPDPKRRAGAFGVWSSVYGASLALGPLLGGVLVDPFGWRAVFLAPLPLCIAAIVATPVVIPAFAAHRDRRMDIPGQILATALLGSLLFCVIEGASRGWLAFPVLTSATIGAVVGVAFILRERRAPAPLLELRLFRSRPLALGLSISVIGLATMAGFLFLTGLQLQVVRGLSPLQTALCLLPVAVATIVLAPIAGRLTAQRGPRTPLATAGAGFITGSVLLLLSTPTGPLPLLLLAYLCFGIGFGMVNAPITTVVVAGLPRSRVGVASALSSTARQAGQAVGVAVFGALATIAADGSVQHGLSTSAWTAWTFTGVGGVLITLLAIAATTQTARARAPKNTVQ